MRSDEARDAVRELQHRGADFIKVYELLPRDAYPAIAEEPKRLGIPFEGHAPVGVTAAEASDAGQKSIEHLNRLLEASTARELELRGRFGEWMMALAQSDPSAASAGERYARAVLDSFDPAARDPLFERLVRNGTWLCPDFVMSRTDLLLSDPAFAADNPAYAYLRPETRERWVAAHEAAVASRETAPARAETALALYHSMEETIRLAALAGVNLVAGTDVGNPFLVPGSHSTTTSSSSSPRGCLPRSPCGPPRSLPLSSSSASTSAS